MTYKGRVRNGVVVLDDAVSLPEASIVRVKLVKPQDDKQTSPSDAVESLRRGLREFAARVHDLPEDLAENPDHHIHGVPPG